jgi:hypothetical protein
MTVLRVWARTHEWISLTRGRGDAVTVLSGTTFTTYYASNDVRAGAGRPPSRLPTTGHVLEPQSPKPLETLMDY